MFDPRPFVMQRRLTSTDPDVCADERMRLGKLFHRAVHLQRNSTLPLPNSNVRSKVSRECSTASLSARLTERQSLCIYISLFSSGPLITTTICQYANMNCTNVLLLSAVFLILIISKIVLIVSLL